MKPHRKRIFSVAKRIGKESPMAKKSNKDLNGIGGWLLFFAIILCWNCVGGAIQPFLYPAVYLGTFYGLVCCFTIILMICSFVLLVKKNILFRTLFVISAAIDLVLMVISREFGSGILSVIGRALWIYYLFNSRRVAVTCGVEPPDSPAAVSAGESQIPVGGEETADASGEPETPPSAAQTEEDEAPAAPKKRIPKALPVILAGALGVTLFLGLIGRSFPFPFSVPEGETSLFTTVAFRSTKWGMTIEEVWEAEGREPDRTARDENPEDPYIADTYEGVEFRGQTWDLVYQYDAENRLTSAMYVKDDLDAGELTEIYHALEGELTAVFGEPFITESETDDYLRFSIFDDGTSAYMISVFREVPEEGIPTTLALQHIPYDLLLGA